jgi:hypothetical protein
MASCAHCCSFWDYLTKKSEWRDLVI